MPPPAPDALLHAARRLLRPLVRLLIRGGVTFPLLSELLRHLYVEIAAREFADKRTPTDSRLSLVTGVHRKEIRRLRLEAPTEDTIPAVVTVGSQIVARWLGTPPYAAGGQPLALPRMPPPEGGASFEGLVASVTTDIRPRAVLDDWLEQGIVSLDARGRVRLDVPAFVPRGGGEQLYYFARNLHDHAAASVANVLSAEAAPFLERSVHYDRLTTDDAARLSTAGRRIAEAALMDINRQALALVDPEPAVPRPHRPTRRVNIGIYLYVEDEPPGGPAE